MSLKSITLNNGYKIPQIGLGTFNIYEDIAATQIIKTAIQLGYRHFDTAQNYNNEVMIGEGIKSSSCSRSKIFITSKISLKNNSYNKAKTSIKNSLESLSVKYIDMMLMHAPHPWIKNNNSKHIYQNIEIWKALEEAYLSNKIKTIGISNFHEHDINILLQHSKIKPAVNQIMAHVGYIDYKLIQLCKKLDIAVEAYSPLAENKILSETKIIQLAQKYNRSSAQISLQFLVQLGLICIPRTTNIQHMQQNINLDFKLSDKDIRTLNEIYIKKSPSK